LKGYEIYGNCRWYEREGNPYKILERKPYGKRSIGRPKSLWDDNEK
jgi:hypothetical protein